MWILVFLYSLSTIRFPVKWFAHNPREKNTRKNVIRIHFSWYWFADLIFRRLTSTQPMIDSNKFPIRLLFHKKLIFFAFNFSKERVSITEARFLRSHWDMISEQKERRKCVHQINSNISEDKIKLILHIYWVCQLSQSNARSKSWENWPQPSIIVCRIVSGDFHDAHLFLPQLMKVQSSGVGFFLISGMAARGIRIEC